MKSPITGGPAARRHTWTERVFRKETFPVCEHYYECLDTRETFTTTELDELNIRQVYNQYRAAHHIPFPDEIRAIREQYGLSAARMSEVLDLGANSYRNYEQGEMPSLANGKLIRLAAEPDNFLKIIQEKQPVFSSNTWARLLARIQGLMNKDRLSDIVAYIWNFHMEPNEFTGFVRPTFEKVAHFVLFFAEKARPLKTRMNKLLYYADFHHFRHTGYAISGCNYRAIPFGPVPSHFHELFGLLEDQAYIRIEQEAYEHGGIGERFVPARAFDPSLFSADELRRMEEVVAAFQEVRTRDLIEISHQERGWADNQAQRNLISYQAYAFELQGLSPDVS